MSGTGYFIFKLSKLKNPPVFFSDDFILCFGLKFLTVVLTQIGYTFNYLHGLHHVA